MASGIPYRWLQVGIIVLIITIVTGLILYVNYSESRQTHEEYTQTLQENTEYTLIQSLKLVDKGLILFDFSLDSRLREPIDLFLVAYEESGGDPSMIDLIGLKNQLGPGYELYIINEAGVIEYTTYLPDHLMDFSVYSSFYQRLTTIREGNEFASERISAGYSGTDKRKFVYHPTPDHRYILELSYFDDEIKLIRQDLRYTETAETIREMNPHLTSVRIFNFLGHEVGNTSYILDNERTAIISRVLSSGEDYEVINPSTGLVTRYIFIDLSNDVTPHEMDLVAELIYSTASINTLLLKVLHSHLFIGVIALLIGGGLAFSTTMYFTRPIQYLMEDTEEIRQGNFRHPIRISSLPELRSFSLSLQEMVRKLNAMMTSLQDSEERYRSVVEDQTELICRFLPDKTIVFANNAYCRYFSLDCTGVIGSKITLDLHEGDIQKVRTSVFSLTTTDPIATVDSRIITPDGRILWQRWNIRAFFDGNGETIEYQAVGRDITEVKEAERALRESEERYRFIAENTADSIWIMDMHLKLKYISPSVERIRGFSVEEVLSQSIDEMMTPESCAYIETLFQTEMDREAAGDADPDRTLTIVTGEYRKDGTIICLESSMKFLRDADGKPIGIIGTSRDITEKKIAEEAWEEAFAQIEDNIYQFSILNDQIRNPISVIMGIADLGGGEEMERIIEQVKVIDEIISRLDQGVLESESIRSFMRKRYPVDDKRRSNK
ncbi:MAG: PAS domain S-box protein [Methanocalculus sp.]|uniref:PAS domain S-box protein n=1 Tax=Methanocalculus sp. TaxID=2004547 RepID=UPI002721C8C0|nr:PAS domain S-box protein [Methanocalculus sp.]MDO9538509.1 PAS domain S-box protein [Methanocalculus sp.]